MHFPCMGRMHAVARFQALYASRPLRCNVTQWAAEFNRPNQAVMQAAPRYESVVAPQRGSWRLRAKTPLGNRAYRGAPLLRVWCVHCTNATEEIRT